MTSVARDLGVSDLAIYTWRRQGRIDRREQLGLTTAEKGELSAANRRIAELLMRRAGPQGVTGRRKRKRIRPGMIAADLVERDFARSGPNQLWVINITEHSTREGKDTYSRRVVGWSVDASPTAALVTNALGMAIDARLGERENPGTVIHSGQGVQFGSWAFTCRAKESGLLASMGSIGDCYDNSMIESFWLRMRTRLQKPRLRGTRDTPAIHGRRRDVRSLVTPATK